MNLVESETLESKEVGNHFIVVFRRKDIEGGPVETMVKTVVKTRDKTRDKSLDDGWYEKWYERWSERLVEGLVENQKKILELIMEKPYISKKEMAERIGISTTAIDKNIRTLKKKGLLGRIGPANGGHWEIIEWTGDMEM